MTAPLPTRRDIAEFFRLGLLVGVCDRSAIVRWADSVLVSEPSPPFAFCDLSICESQPLNSALGFLTEVPGDLTPELPVFMLLGHCSKRAKAGSRALAEILIRLNRMARTEHFPDHVYFALISLDEDMYLAGESIQGTVADAEQAFTDYLARYKPYAPDNLA